MLKKFTLLTFAIVSLTLAPHLMASQPPQKVWRKPYGNIGCPKGLENEIWLYKIQTRHQKVVTEKELQKLIQNDPKNRMARDYRLVQCQQFAQNIRNLPLPNLNNSNQKHRNQRRRYKKKN